MNSTRHALPGLLAAALVALATGCGGSDDDPVPVTAVPASIDAKATCASLASLALTDTTIVSAVEVAAGPPPAGTPAPTFLPVIAATTLPAYCKVTATIVPSIGIEVWMPLKSWNGRFEGVGNHQFAGALDYGDMSYQMTRGYAVASTDAGHQGTNPLPWMQNAQQIVDYGYRGVHEMTLKAKAIIAAYYGQSANYNYWNGCSTGGKEALMEAQRYPDDYHGIVVGDPNFDQIGNRAMYVWDAQVTFANPATALSQAQLVLINNAVLKTCDANDGVTDGSVENPATCNFQPSSLVCTAGQDPTTCLTAAQAGALANLYAGPKNPRTGAEVYTGWPKGSELGWGGVIAGPGVFSTADQFFKNMVFKNQAWDWHTFNFDSDVTFATSNFGSLVNAVDPDLTPLEVAGTKMLHYHGWRDTNHPAGRSVEYYESVLAKLNTTNSRSDAITRTQKFYRLFMSPGSNGCTGGSTNPGNFDPMDTMITWVEGKTAPDRIVVNHLTGSVVDRTRPICPYPKIAAYNGTGSTDDAANFTCQ
jgi:feruloyl esterase